MDRAPTLRALADRDERGDRRIGCNRRARRDVREPMNAFRNRGGRREHFGGAREREIGIGGAQHRDAGRWGRVGTVRHDHGRGARVANASARISDSRRTSGRPDPRPRAGDPADVDLAITLQPTLEPGRDLLELQRRKYIGPPAFAAARLRRGKRTSDVGLWNRCPLEEVASRSRPSIRRSRARDPRGRPPAGRRGAQLGQLQPSPAPTS